MDFAADALLMSQEADEYGNHPPARRLRKDSLESPEPRGNPSSPTSAPRRPRPSSWQMWFAGRVGVTEAAFSSILGRESVIPLLSGRAPPSEKEQRDDDQVLSPVGLRPASSSSIDMSLMETWGAMRRAAAAVLATFEEPSSLNESGGGPSDESRQNETEQNCKEGGGMRRHVSATASRVPKHDCSEQERVATPRKLPYGKDWDGETYPTNSAGQKERKEGKDNDDVTESSSTENSVLHTDKGMLSCAGIAHGGDDTEELDHPVFSTGDGDSEALAGENTASPAQFVLEESGEKKEPSTASSEQPLAAFVASALDTYAENAPCDEESAAYMVTLRKHFNYAFEQNGGTECVGQVKEIGDAALAQMKDSAHMDAKVMAELDCAKLIIDSALQRLDVAVRSKVNEENPDFTDAASVAESIIAEGKENLDSNTTWAEERAAVLISDGSRLLAVFATKTCASVLDCLKFENTQSTWSERVEKMADTATVGVLQLRTVSYTFAGAIAKCRNTATNGIPVFDMKSEWPAEMLSLNETAVGQVLHCVALAIAALQIEAAERAYQCSVQK